MVKRKARAVALAIYFLDIALTIIAFYLAYWIRAEFFTEYIRLLPVASYQWLLVFVVAFWTPLLYFTGAYRLLYLPSSTREILRLWVAVILGVTGLTLVIFLSKSVYISRLFVLIFAVLDLAILSAGRVFVFLVASLVVKSPMHIRNVVIVGTGEDARKLAESIRSHRNWGLNFLGYIREEAGEGTDPAHDEKVLGSIDGIQSIIHVHFIDEVIFAVSKNKIEAMEDVFLTLEDEGINARLALNIFPHMIAKVHIEELDDTPLLTFTTIPTNEFALFFKRVFDIFISFFLLLVLSPLMLAIALLIKATSRGPVLFSQKRCGLNGRPFDFYKFRSMYVNAEEIKEKLTDSNEMEGPVFKIKDDPRVTPIGRFIRKTSLDETPQLWNVFRGDMSMVGPRPPLPEEVANYKRWQRRRLSMKPGLTCIWQVNGRNQIQFHEWMKLDLQYIDNWSLWLDFKILFKTIPAVLSGKGAY